MEILFLIIGLIVGFVIAFLFQKSKKTIPLEEANSQIEQINFLKVEAGKIAERTKFLEEEKISLQTDLKNERTKGEELNSAHSSLKTDHTNLQQKLSEQKEEVEKLQEKFTIEFENLANKIFEEKSSKFTDQNKTQLQEILDPLKERISEFQNKVEESNKESIDRNAALRQQLSSLKELNQQITLEAKNLTTALKGQVKTQGNWGEFILESILEKSGLVKGREYVVQQRITSETGKRYQPDVVILLPENKSIVIDSKVSLNAYEKFTSTDDEHQKQLALREHINSIRSHIKILSLKNYQSL